jgi:hypothetical protein
MAQVIRSSDILAICFMLSGDDLDADIAGILEKLEAFAQKDECLIGTSPDDLCNALFWLTYDMELSDIGDYERFPERMRQMRLRDLVRPMLLCRELYCNDEGEYWEGTYELEDTCNDSRGNWLDDVYDPVDIKYEYDIRRLFEHPDSLTGEAASAFFREHQSYERILRNRRRSLDSYNC